MEPIPTSFDSGRERFFPPPFRIDIDGADYRSLYSNPNHPYQTDYEYHQQQQQASSSSSSPVPSVSKICPSLCLSSGSESLELILIFPSRVQLELPSVVTFKYACKPQTPAAKEEIAAIPRSKSITASQQSTQIQSRWIRELRMEEIQINSEAETDLGRNLQ